MSLLNILRNSILTLGFASCVSSPDLDYKKDKFSPLYFTNSPHVQVTKYHGSVYSKKHLFHIRQMHFDKDGNREGYDLTNSCQKEIYHFLRDIKFQGVRELYVEGFDDSPFTTLRPAENYMDIMSYIMKSGLFTSDIASGNNDSFKFIPGADLLMGMTGEYSLIPAENFLFHERAILSIQTGCMNYEHLFRSRENYLVEKIANSDNSHAFFVYGAAHNFIDDVALWNLKNPNNQISITELTPKSLIHLKN